MIQTEYLTPEVYYKESRDFQLLGRIYDILFNYLKTNINTIQNFPLSRNMDRRFLELLATTLGFKIKHHYSEKQLLSFCSVFSEAVKKKGSKEAIELSAKALLAGEGISEEPEVVIDSEDKWLVKIYVPTEFADLNLLKDLLDYILPAGMTCRIFQSISEKSQSTTYAVTADTVSYASAVSKTTSFIPNREELESPSEEPAIAGPLNEGGGRLGISVIPDITESSEIIPDSEGD